jgi:urease accessory protein
MNEYGISFISALQLSDSFFPTGSYTLSYGLESCVHNGVVENGNDLKMLIESNLRNQLGPLDMGAISNVYDASEDGDLGTIIDIDNELHSFKVIKESREGSLKTGKQFSDIISKTEETLLIHKYKDAINNGEANGHHSIVLGMVSQSMGITKEQSCMILGYTYTIGLLGASMRLFRMGHSEGQVILSDMKKIIVDVCRENIHKGIDEMGSFSPIMDIMGMMHEESESRIFFN